MSSLKGDNKLPTPKGEVAIVASILGADYMNIGAEIEAAEEGGADWLQIDVMDGHFVPNMSFGPDMVRAISKRTALPIDVHLMIENPDKYIERFARYADLITVHLEALDNPKKTIDSIKSFGCKAGLALKPKTPVEKAREFVKDIDLLLIMTVEPGFGGQGFLLGSEERISSARKLLDENDKNAWLQVDGGIYLKTAPLVVSAGANSLVAGSAIFGEGNPKKNIYHLRKSYAQEE
jgi:ribulose-phosphate 3-epimerase